MSKQETVNQAQLALAELCKKYNVRIEPRVTILDGNISADLLIMANPTVSTESESADPGAPSKHSTRK